MLIPTGMDPCSYEKKPKNGYEFDQMRKRAADNWGSYELLTVADMVGNKGHAILPSHLVGGYKSENCTEQQVYILDFDNDRKDVTVVGFDEIRKRADEYGLSISFAYQTFNSGRIFDDSGKAIERFRVVFIKESSETSPFVIQCIKEILMFIFPEADSQCKDCARVFCGGKQLIYLDEEARISAVSVCFSILKKLSGSDKHRIDKAKRFCRETGIMMYNGLPLIGEKRNLDLVFGENVDSDIYSIYMIGESEKSPCFIIKETKKNLHSNRTCKDMEVHKVNFQEEYQQCRLLEDFTIGTHLDHNSRFHIMTNMLHLNGGIKLFMKTMREYYPESAEKWESCDIRYAKIQKYGASRCSEENCRYFSSCDHRKNIVETLLVPFSVKEINPVEYESLDAACEHIHRCIEDFSKKDKKGISILKAQTGIGKTKLYIEFLMENPFCSAVVAVPSNKLKYEVKQRMLDCGIDPQDIFVTPNVGENPFVDPEVQNRVSLIHESGVHNMTSEVIQKYRKQLDEASFEQQRELKRIENGMKEYRGQRIILTTHAYFCADSCRMNDGRIIFIDEDILSGYLMKRIYQITRSGVEYLKSSGLAGYSDLAEEMLNSKAGIYTRVSHRFFDPVKGEITEICLKNDYGNLYDLRFASSYVRHSNPGGDDSFLYFCRQTLPAGKYLIMSATADPVIYRRYFQNLEVALYPEVKARYRGRIIQYFRHELGRNSLNNHLEEAADLVNQVIKPDGLISFKNHTNILVKEVNASCSKHFGDTMGYDDMKGMNIAVIGTYYQNPDVYKLIASSMGENVNGKENLNPRRQRVEYNNLSFVITTYSSFLLRTLQLYLIASEEEQAVGRARLLRNDCSVLVLSAFPCEQAEFRSIEYLKPVETVT